MEDEYSDNRVVENRLRYVGVENIAGMHGVELVRVEKVMVRD